MENTPRRRNRLPVRAPSSDRTKLFKISHGPHMIVCLHETLGFHIGCINGMPLWSHDPQSETIARLLHRDSIKSATSWKTEQEAKKFLFQQLSLSETQKITFLKIKSDIATSPPEREEQKPIFMCSIIKCCETISDIKQITPLPIHELPKDIISR